MNSHDRSARELLVGAIDVFLEHNEVNEIVITRSRNAMGVEFVNVFKGENGKMLLVMVQRFKEKNGETIHEQNPEWRKKFLE